MRWLPLTILALSSILFFLFGLAMIPYAGVQGDEAIFSNCLFPNSSPWFAISVFKKKVPLMVMSYLGASKAALFSGIFAVFAPSAYSLRIPTLLLGLVTIPVFYGLLRQFLKPGPAAFGASLLSCDSSYLLTSVFDWGPVAIQHLCLLAGCLLVIQGYRRERLRWIWGGFFLFGLGLWDKALFVWMLLGLGLATAVAFPRELLRALKPKWILAAGIGFLLGSLPLVIYNIRRPLETFRGNARFSTKDFQQKLQLPRATLEGSALFGYLVEENHAVTPRRAKTITERVSLSLSDFVGERRANFYGYAFLISLLLTPALLVSRYRRPVAFTLIFLTVAWAQMLFVQNAGGGVHHVILLWPFPLLLISCAVAWMGEKFGYPNLVVSAAGLLLCVSGLLVHNHYLAQLIRNGGPGVWTDAIFPLARQLEDLSPKQIFVTDWGILDNVRLLQQGRIPIYWGSEPLMSDTPDAAQIEAARRMFATPGAVFVSYTDDRQVFGPVNGRLRKLSESFGFQRELLAVIHDGNGRPAFEIFYFRKQS
ncbi:MAG: glycosyltransferase family 39 protein [Bryobacteraceae bacterium]|nr:glycosyltransferase family 39 protein [Bryobacteraceae bacterium]MDW8377570.1 glycosyltransferase family 39 protein [Bryobacterales bacterium]